MCPNYRDCKGAKGLVFPDASNDYRIAPRWEVRRTRIKTMSRGWESKSVESQQASQEAAKTETPASQAASQRASVVEMKGNIAADAERKRQRQALELQRERILSERTSSPHRRTALATALLEIEEKLSELGWTVHL